jgi:hypothetical protein
MCQCLEVLVAHQQVIAPLAWCGAATAIIYGERGDRLALLASFTSGLARALVARPNLVAGRDSVTRRISLVELQRGVGVIFAYRYNRIKLLCQVCISLTHCFTFPHFILASCMI